jgi:hypothetical protein
MHVDDWQRNLTLSGGRKHYEEANCVPHRHSERAPEINHRLFSDSITFRARSMSDAST